jgi:putative hydrolase of the HAD superfamily
VIQRMVSVYRSHRPQLSLLPDAAKCLEQFHGTALLALITDGPPESQRRKVNALHLDSVFQLIVLTGSWGTEFSKPHARAFRLVESHLRPASGRFMYIADNPLKDFIAPAGLGWETVRVRRREGLHAGREAELHQAATVEVADLEGLYDFVTADRVVAGLV